MSSAQRLREFIQQRLTAAAEEIFTEFGKTIVRYEEEIDRQRRLLDISCKPETELHATDLPQQHACKETGGLTDQPLCNHERNSSVDQEELCSSRGQKQLVLKEETDTIMMTATHEENEQSEPEPIKIQLVFHSPDTFTFDEFKAEEPFAVNTYPVQHEEGIDHRHRQPDITWKPEIRLYRIDLSQQCVTKDVEGLTDQQLYNQEKNSSQDQEEPEPPQSREGREKLCTSMKEERLLLKEETDSLMVTASCEERDHKEPQINGDQLLSHGSHETRCRDQEGNSNVEDSGSTRNTKRSHEGDAEDSPMSENQLNIDTVKQSLKCDFSGKNFRKKSQMKSHQRIHTSKKLFSCKTCGKSFIERCDLKEHMRSHSHEKPYLCNTGGKSFTVSSSLKKLKTVHTGEKSHHCKTCGKTFTSSGNLRVHVRTHTGEKPYVCNICSKRFSVSSSLRTHKTVHTGEKSHHCKTCGKAFTRGSNLRVHMRTHTGEKPYPCKTCGKTFRQSHHLLRHENSHR